MNFKKNVTNNDIKSDQKTKLYTLQTVSFLKYNGYKVDLFWNETSVLIFPELAIFHSI